MHVHTERHTHRERHTHIYIGREIERHTHANIRTHTDIQTRRHKNTQTSRHKNTQTYRHAAHNLTVETQDLEVNERSGGLAVVLGVGDRALDDVSVVKIADLDPTQHLICAQDTAGAANSPHK